jgi:dTMP kinase
MKDLWISFFIITLIYIAMMSRGRLITLEGIDGTGKSSITRMLKKRFEDAVFTREPTNSWIGKAVKRSIESDGDPIAELFLFIADHAEHITRVIRPALEEGKLVISDRYSDSRYAYQGATLSDLFDDAMGWIQSIHTNWTVAPDLTILFRIDPVVAVSRCGFRGDRTKFEKIAFLNKVQGNYLELMKREPERFVIVDAGMELEDVEREVYLIIDKFLA